MQTISLGKYRRLNRCSSDDGTFSILAIDHRTSLMKAMGDQLVGMNAAQSLIDFKEAVIGGIAGYADSILLDPQYGAAQGIISRSIPPEKGVIVAIERSGYRGSSILRENELLTGWSVEKAARAGLDAIKLLVYYHPDAKNASITEPYITEVAELCNKYELPFFLEIVTYSLDPEIPHLVGEDRKAVILDSARRLSRCGADILKVQFPVDIKTVSDRNKWAESCRELTNSSCCPWILLSASIDYVTFKEQVVIACENGSSGIAVGRALWQEALAMNTAGKRKLFFSTIGRERMEILKTICGSRGRSWRDYWAPPAVNEKWYEDY